MKNHVVEVKVSKNKLAISGLKTTVKIKNEQITWKCSGASMRVLFTKTGSPFSWIELNVADGGSTDSGPPVNISPKSYDYTMYITPPSAAVITVDPQVVVDDSGPPPGGGGGKGKGAGKGTTKKGGAKKKGGTKKRAALRTSKRAR